MNTESRRKASAAYHAKREAAGMKKVTLWLDEDTRAELERLAKAYGSKDKAAAMCINHHSDAARSKAAKAAAVDLSAPARPEKPRRENNIPTSPKVQQGPIKATEAPYTRKDTYPDWMRKK